MLGRKKISQGGVGNGRFSVAGKPLPTLIVAVVILYLLVALVLGMFWSRTPRPFDVEQNANQAIAASHRKMVPGVVLVETLKRTASTLLDKSGGYLTNDVAPPGLWLDNMPSWEYGVLVQVRDMTRALRKDFARSQSQSAEDPDLAQAEPLFNFNNKSWALPSSESQYRKAIAAVDAYEARLADPEVARAHFYSRADNLSDWLGDVATRLGSLSQRLSASVGRVRLDVTPNTEQVASDERNLLLKEQTIRTPWLHIDNVYYEARGQAWALALLLRAVEVDFADVLAQKSSAVSLRQIIRELESTQHTLWSPMVLNGSGFGLLANHSLVMANYISRASAAIIDLRDLLSRG